MRELDGDFDGIRDGVFEKEIVLVGDDEREVVIEGVLVTPRDWVGDRRIDDVGDGVADGVETGVPDAEFDSNDDADAVLVEDGVVSGLNRLQLAPMEKALNVVSVDNARPI